MEEPSESPTEPSQTHEEDDEDVTDSGGESSDNPSSGSSTDTGKSSESPVKRLSALDEDDKEGIDDDVNEEDEEIDILGLTDEEESSELPLKPSHAHDEDDEDDTDTGDEEEDCTGSLSDTEESSQLAVMNMPLKRSSAVLEDDKDGKDDDGDGKEEKTDILTCCSPTHVQKSSELAVRRSHTHHEDDGGNKKDERTDRGHEKSTENQLGSEHKRRRVSDSEIVGHGTSKIEYRVLCPAKKIGAVIGRGGSVIKALRRDTKAEIRVDNARGVGDERIIYVSSAPGLDRAGSGHDGDEAEMLCLAQEALFRIYHCITKQEDNVFTSDEKEDENKPSSKVSICLLVPGSQVGRLIGHHGRNIELMRKDTGAQIDVLKTRLPPGVFSMDECVQLFGTPLLVKKALYAVSSKLYKNSMQERLHQPSHASQGAGGGMYPLAVHAPLGLMVGMGHHDLSGPGTSGAVFAPGLMMAMGHHGLSGPGYSGAMRNSRTNNSLGVELKVSVLYPKIKTAMLIGKGGSAAQKLREDCDAKIKICREVEDCDEGIIQISAIEHMNSPAFPVLDAVLKVHWRLVDITGFKDGRNSIFSRRLLVSAHQTGCLLGLRGQTIIEMRRSSGADIHIARKNELPRCADAGSDLVQVIGTAPTVEAGLVQVLTTLRRNLF